MHPENEFCMLYQEMTRRTAALMQESFIRYASSPSTVSSEEIPQQTCAECHVENVYGLGADLTPAIHGTDWLFAIIVFIWLVSCLLTFIVCLGKTGTISKGRDKKTPADGRYYRDFP